MRFDGKSNKQVATRLKIGELSNVTQGAHDGADVTLLKVDENSTTFLKAAFEEALELHLKRDELSKFTDNLWTYRSALNDAIWSIVDNPENYVDPVGAVKQAALSFANLVQTMDDELVVKMSQPANFGKKTEAKIMPDTNISQADFDAAKSATLKVSAKLSKVCLFSTQDFEYMKKLGNAEQQSEFIDLDAAQRAAMIKAANDADPVVYKTSDGVELRKSEGELMINMAKNNDRITKENEELKKQNAQKDSEAEVGLLMSKFKGEPTAKTALLAAVNGIENEELRKGAKTIIEDANEILASGFKTFGKKVDDTDFDENEASGFEQGLAKFAKAKNLPEHEVMAEYVQTPEGGDLYKQQSSH